MRLRATWGGSPGAAGLLLMLVLALACGARTGLQQPCEQPLERVRPSVLFMLSHGGELGQKTNYFRSQGRPLGVLFREELEEIGPDVAEAARFGVLVHPNKPAYNDRMYDNCGAQTGLQLPMGEHLAAGLEESWFRHALFIGPPPHDPNCCWGFAGLNVVGPNLPLAAASLRADARPHAELFLVLATRSHGDCGPFREWADNLPAVLQTLVALRNEGIRTLVVGLDSGEAGDTTTHIGFLAQMAVAGGLARTDGHLSRDVRREEFPFVDVWDRAQVRRELRHRVLSSYWCRGMVGSDLDLSRRDLIALRTDGRVIPRDTTHRDGWDHDGSRFVTLYGPACEAVQDDRQDVRFVLPTERCP